MVSRVYNRVAPRYDEDWSGIYAAARARCMRQIAAQLDATDKPLEIVDLGVGTGNSLADLRRLVPLGNCTGFDLSTGMLTEAAHKLKNDATLIQADAINASTYLKPASIDLALCHFILSFVDTDRLLQMLQGLLKPGGLVSLATSTQQSLRELHSGRFRRSGQLLGVRRSLRKAATPVDHQQCLETLQSHGFEIVVEHLHRQPICFESFSDVRDWALNSGWVALSLEGQTGLRVACATVAFALARVFMHPLYPINAVNEISIVLARKPLLQPACDEHKISSNIRSGGPRPIAAKGDSTSRLRVSDSATGNHDGL